jgi:hypothetical protein
MPGVSGEEVPSARSNTPYGTLLYERGKKWGGALGGAPPELSRLSRETGVVNQDCSSLHYRTTGRLIPNLRWRYDRAWSTCTATAQVCT